jgi:thioredoxin-dependent peroxiredoxin
MEKISKEILNLTLPDTDGNPIRLADFAGKYIVLYFYPKDDTPGCTVEACSFRDFNADITKLGITILGVSKDTVVSHQKFTKKYKLSFPLISDPESKLAKAFDVWKLKKFMGREFMGIVRTTLIIDPKGSVIKRFDNVKPLGHAQQVLNELTQLRRS